ncbi:hypothetical protein [Lacibacter sp. H407]|uniref:hypothetical protein n=1 Tax=Lacibacter sp. H407 TaxID=3133423 RepID=UPI0030C4EA17
MKWIFWIMLFSVPVASLAQDTVQPIKLLESQKTRLLSSASIAKLPVTTSQRIYGRIHHFLDSMVATADKSALFIKKIKTGVSEILNEFWKAGFLLGDKTSNSFYVICGAQTMTAKDIAEGRLVIIVGYALTKIGEFEIKRFERMLINKTPLQYASNF